MRSERATAAVTEGSVGMECLGDNAADNMRQYANDETRRQATWQAKHKTQESCNATKTSEI